MKRSTLSPVHAKWLADTIARNSRFDGMRMMADGDGSDAGADKDKGGDGSDKDADADKSTDKGSDADKLGDGGKKAIQAERDRAKAADDRARALEGEFSSFKKALLDGFGIKTDDDDKGEDALAAVQKQLAEIQRESAVLRLANTHKITDEGDLKILASATDAEQMKALAERLAPAEGEQDATSRKRPKPDRTQGGGTTAAVDNSGVSHGRDLFKSSRSKTS